MIPCRYMARKFCMSIGDSHYSHLIPFLCTLTRGTGVFARVHQPFEAMRALHMAALPNEFHAIRGLHGVQIAELQSAADLRRKGLND